MGLYVVTLGPKVKGHRPRAPALNRTRIDRGGEEEERERGGGGVLDWEVGRGQGGRSVII